MKQIGAFKAKTHFSEILAAVSTGEEFAITRHGHTVAMLTPYSEVKKESSSKANIRAIRKLRSGLKLGKKLSIQKMKEEGRK